MKKNFLLAGLIAISAPMLASDTLFVHAPQIPLLINQADNVLFEFRMDADKGDVLNEISIEFDQETNLADIESVRLFYSGTEGVARKGTYYAPSHSYRQDFLRASLAEKGVKFTPEISDQRSLQQLKSTNRDYSIQQDEINRPASSIQLSSQQPLLKGTNYFWVSVQVKNSSSLESLISARISQAQINQQPAVISGDQQSGKRRKGVAVRQAWDDGVAAFRIPGIVTTNNGTLIGCYDVRYNSSVDLQEKIDIGVSRSFDKGQTWEPMQIAMSFGETGGLPHAQNGVGDPSILVDETNNTIWIVAAWCHGMGNQRAWVNSQQGMTMDETAQLVLCKSEDDGKTWSEPINITEQVKDPSWYFLLQGPGRGITMSDGTLVFPIQFIDANKIPNAGIMYSKDHGKTWHLHNAARSNTTESQVAEIEPGVLMLNMRDNRGGSRAVSITKDLGKTWTEHPSNRSALQEPICMASLIKIPADKNCLKKDILLFSNPNTTKNRNHITIKASLDGGLTWPEEYQILLDEGEGWGYTCLTLVDEETVGIFYESSVAHMTFQKVKLRELIRP